MVFLSLQNFLLEDVGALQWKLQPPLEGEEKDEVDMKEMLSEIASFAQRIEDLAIEVNLKNYTSFFGFSLICSFSLNRGYLDVADTYSTKDFPRSCPVSKFL